MTKQELLTIVNFLAPDERGVVKRMYVVNPARQRKRGRRRAPAAVRGVEGRSTADSGITVDSSAIIESSQKGLSGGTAGEWYPVTCRTTTSNSRTDDCSAKIVVEEQE